MFQRKNKFNSDEYNNIRNNSIRFVLFSFFFLSNFQHAISVCLCLSFTHLLSFWFTLRFSKLNADGHIRHCKVSQTCDGLVRGEEVESQFEAFCFFYCGFPLTLDLWLQNVCLGRLGQFGNDPVFRAQKRWWVLVSHRRTMYNFSIGNIRKNAARA